MYLFFHVGFNSESELNKQYGPFSLFQYILIRIIKENGIAFCFFLMFDFSQDSILNLNGLVPQS